MQKIKKIVKNFCPPIIKDLILSYKNKFGYFGDFNSWEDASSSSDGYDKDIILKKVKESTWKVKTGQAVYERDSVIFDKIEHSWPLLSCLLWIATKENRLHLVDFGGSLGSTYFQCISFLKHLQDIKWSIIEQENFVTIGQKFFKNEHLKFYSDLETYTQNNTSETIILSSVLQYLKNPYQILEKIKNTKFKYILIDRTTVLTSNKPNRITIQKVPPHIYDASYPCRFFNENNFLNYFSPEYKLICEFDALGGNINEHGIKGKNMGYFFELI